MNFTYELGKLTGLGDFDRLETLDGLSEITDEMVTAPKVVVVRDEVKSVVVAVLDSPDKLLGWQTGGERAFAWKPGDRPVVQKAVAAAVNPSHYKGYIEEMQWIDAMSRIPSMRDPKCFKAALELQIRKYLDRSGQKDATIQEMMKARWYLSYLCAYIANGDKPTLVADVDRLIASIK
jgi:hypothetical protein